MFMFNVKLLYIIVALHNLIILNLRYNKIAGYKIVHLRFEKGFERLPWRAHNGFLYVKGGIQN